MKKEYTYVYYLEDDYEPSFGLLALEKCSLKEAQKKFFKHGRERWLFLDEEANSDDFPIDSKPHPILYRTADKPDPIPGSIGFKFYQDGGYLSDVWAYFFNTTDGEGEQS